MPISVLRNGAWVGSTATAGVVPGTPTGVTVTSTIAGQIDVTWTAPVSVGSSPITSYLVTATNSTSGVSSTDSVSATARHASITGFTSGAGYNVIVQALNATGSSVASSPVFVVVAGVVTGSYTGLYGSFPSASTTGITGVGLSPSDLTASGPIVISAPNTVLDKLDISGGVSFLAGADVTGWAIKRCRITISAPSSVKSTGYAISLAGAAQPGIISDVEFVDATPSDALYGPSGAIFHSGPDGTQILRCYSATFSRFVTIGSTALTVQDNCVPLLRYYPGTANTSATSTHNECLYLATSKGGLVVRHNTLLNNNKQTAAIFIDAKLGGQIIGATFDTNLCAGGGYIVYAGGGYSSTANGFTWTNNVFSRLIGTAPGTQPYPAFFVNGGFFGGPTSIPRDATSTWSGNIWGDDGSVIP